MKTVSALMGMAAIAGLLVGTPALAKSKSGTPKVTCQQIHAAMSSGKTADEVATELKVSPEHVKSCGSPTEKHHHTQKPATPKPAS